jgi:hypothetical protein
MRYLYLSEIGSKHTGEEGTEGVRVHALSGVEAQLKAAMVNLANAQRSRGRSLPALPATVTDPQRIAAAREAEATAARFIETRAANIAEYQRQVRVMREVLTRQGCVLAADGSIVWDESHTRVVYDHDPVVRSMTRVHVRGGRLFTAADTPLDTRDMVTQFSGPGHAIFVMTATGNIHVSSHSVGHRHHSSLLAGRNVAAAGELICHGGNLKWLSNKSGHYQPGIGHLLQVLHQIQKNGIPMTFSLLVLPMGHRYNNVGNFMKRLESRYKAPDFELAKLMAYSEHLTDAVLGTHTPNRWRWRLPRDKQDGVYDVATNALVPHREVRKWLKSIGRMADETVQEGDGR